MSKLFARIRQLLPIYAGIWVGGLLLVFLATMIAAAFAASVAVAGHVPGR